MPNESQYVGSEVQGAGDRWTIDKKIPVSLIACFLVQTFLWGGYIATNERRAEYFKEALEQLKTNQIPATTIAISGERLSTLQEKVTDIKGDVGDLKKTVGELKEEIRRSGFNGRR